MNKASPKKTFQGILFDLDGTLLDTAGDLGHALNRILIARGHTALPLAQIRSWAGRGCKGLLKLGLNMDDSHPDYLAHCEELLDYYQQHMLDTTQLFSGMHDVLMQIEKMHLPWGIVTNKPERYTHELIDALQLKSRIACVISGDTLQNRKPHPEPILQACQLMQREPSDCLYVGDAEIDIIASKAAGTASLVALYGYIPTDIDPMAWKADGYIHHPSEILQWI